MPGIDHAVNISFRNIPNHPCYSVGKYRCVDNLANVAETNERTACETVGEVLQLTLGALDRPLDVRLKPIFELGAKLLVSTFVSFGDPAIDRASNYGGRGGVQNVVGVAASRAELRRDASPEGESEACALLLAEAKEAPIKQCIEPNVGVHGCLRNGTLQVAFQDRSYSK
jgi:hypothetical protein